MPDREPQSTKLVQVTGSSDHGPDLKLSAVFVLMPDKSF
jgi:hypothetical protein